MAGLGTADEVCPFSIESVYQSATVFAQHYNESESQESLDALNDCKLSLRMIDERWKLAGNRNPSSLNSLCLTCSRCLLRHFGGNS